MMEMGMTKQRTSKPVGQVVFARTQTTQWPVPSGVRSICAVTVGIGGSGSGSGGGGLSWTNNIAVTPGEILTIAIDGVGTTSRTRVMRGTTVLCVAGAAIGKTGGLGGVAYDPVNHGGGNGGAGGSGTYAGGGGAGGYSGNGGAGAVGNVSTGPDILGSAGQGGAGGGGSGWWCGGGGGVGLLGEGASGNGGTGNVNSTSNGGGGGSGGAPGGGYGVMNGGTGIGCGGLYGGGSGTSGSFLPGEGGVRLIWGLGRAFPSTLTADQPVVV